METDLRFYLDVHIPAAVRNYLLRRGADTVAGHAAAGERASDEQHLTAAIAESRVLITRDGDFAAFHL
jgi:predicted nuclease of predicted toxin-antitoxin system